MTAPHYQALFSDASLAGVHHLPHGSVEDLTDGARNADCLLIRIDLSGIRSKDELLSVIGKALRFPEWYGHNWDALADCLADMGWLPALGYVIILDHCDGIHGCAEADFVKLMQVFQEAAETWREDGTPFWCLVDMQADGIAWLPTAVQPD